MEVAPKAGRSRLASGWPRLTLCLALLAGVGAFALLILAPAYWAPSSRVYASALGYPSLMRLAGRPIPVQAEPVQARAMVRVIAAEGETAYLNEIPIFSEVPGIVTELAVEEGQKTERGDLLLRISPGGHTTQLFRLRKELADWELRQAELVYEGERELFDRRLISRARLTRAEVNVRSARTRSILSMEEHAHALRSRTATVTGEPPPWLSFPVDSNQVDIVATASGTAIERRAQLGQNWIDLREPLLVIGDRLVFRAYLDQRHVGEVGVGDRGRFHLRARPGAVFPSTVLRVDPEVATGQFPSGMQPPFTFAVWMTIPQEALAGEGLLSGMNGFAIFERPYVAPAVPASALMRYSGQTGTLLVVDESNLLQIKAISYTGAEDGWVAVESAELAEGDLVVVNGQIGLRPGDQVTVADRGDATLQADLRSVARKGTGTGVDVVPGATAAGVQ